MQKVGYQTKSPNEADPSQVNEYYKNLNISTNYFDNGVEFFKFGNAISWNDLLKPTNRDRWGMSAPTVNAYYSPSGNEIVFPAGIMQDPVFGGDLPPYVSYGAFGAVAGHELTHGFDNNGAKYDEKGTYRVWWDNSTVSAFEDKTKCFISQYEKYTVEGLDGERVKLNGKLTLGENIADAGGLNNAYKAWKKRDLITPDSSLPGLETFTNDQLFFLSYANWWCGKARKEAVLSQVYTDPHSPADKRILGTLDNSADFKKAFGCKKVEPTCQLW